MRSKIYSSSVFIFQIYQGVNEHLFLATKNKIIQNFFSTKYLVPQCIIHILSTDLHIYIFEKQVQFNSIEEV